MGYKNLWLIKAKQDPIKGQLILRHIWKGTSNECRSLWRFNEDVVIDGIREYTTLNGSFRDVYNSFKAQYLYVTSKDPYQKGDWIKNITIEAEPPFKLDVHGIRYTQLAPCKFDKVVSTTDDYLIQDGVQRVQDDFLDWFCKNPSCEEVKLERTVNGYYWKKLQLHYKFNYKIIIPSEEPKQELEKEMFELEQQLDIPSNLRWHNSKPKQELERGITITHVGKQEPKQEKLEEVLKNEIEFIHNSVRNYDFDLGFKTGGLIGAKWQTERSYSDEEISYLLYSFKNYLGFGDEVDEKKWFEQSKK